MKEVMTEVGKLGLNKDMYYSLEKNYREALRDEKFKSLVSKLKISDNVLMKYTSSLEESAFEFDNCLKCKSLLECKNKIEGYAYLPKVSGEKLEFQYKACKYKKEQFEDTKHLNNILLVNAPKGLLEAKMKNIYSDDKNRFETIKWLKEFITNYKKDKKQKGLYLYGNFGCGKSFLIAAMFNELAKEKIKSAIIFYPEFLRDLKSSFDTDFNQKFESVKKVPLLLIDDIGAENTTAWGRDEILCPILQYRMDEHLPTFFTSNLDIKGLEEHLSFSKTGIESVKARRIISRIEQLTEKQEMISKNLRK